MKNSNIPCLILCGGKGTRFGELTKKIPKPMLKVNGKPILIHIMDIYIKNGFRKFIILAGYKKEIIKKYFSNKIIYKNKKRFDVLKINKKLVEIRILNTGLNSLKKERIQKAKKIIESENFFLTYGDGLGNINIKKSLNLHLRKKSLITITAVRPPSRFGELVIKNNTVLNFNEKHSMSRGFINGGFIICNFKIFDFFDKSKKDFEDSVIDKLTKQKKVFSYKHLGFWQCADNERELKLLNYIYKNK